MNDSIRIKLSLGLIAVAVVHAILLGVVFNALHNQPIVKPNATDSWTPPSMQPSAPTVGSVEKLAQPQSVNLQAQGEIKQQSAACAPNCPPSRVVSPAVVVLPQVQPAAVTTPSFVNNTSPVTPTSAPATPPPKKSYQLALFVGSDATSRTLLQWFSSDKELLSLKENCEFQVYTADSAIYKTRFVEIVPASQFPVVLFQDATGGHIHAAGRSMIPGSAAELYSDLKHGFALYKQAKEAQKTGALKTRGYSWDDAISPKLYLSAEDCPDGYCPTPTSEPQRPLDRVRDLFDDAKDTRNALMWLSAGEIATVALIAIAVVLLVFILLKRGIN